MKTGTFAIFILIVIGSVSVYAVEIGDTVAPFEALDDSGKVWQSSDVLGTHNLIVYFYPAAMTGGCTKQACSYRDQRGRIDSLDAVIVGISGDAVQNLHWFKLTHMLNFTLLSDPQGKIAAIFGVPTKAGGSIEREVDGEIKTLKRDVTTQRWTFVLDKKGKVVYKQAKVKPLEDSMNVINVLKKMHN